MNGGVVHLKHHGVGLHTDPIKQVATVDGAKRGLESYCPQSGHASHSRKVRKYFFGVF